MDRLLPPEETVDRLRPILPRCGVTRVADITGLDCLGIPVVTVIRPNARSLSVAQGKGLTLAAALASGMMEAIETWHAEQFDGPLRFASARQLRQRLPLAEVDRLPRAATSPYHDDLCLLWTEGEELLSGEPRWVPYEMVHCNYTVATWPGQGCFAASSNGLAAGNSLLEATLHALYELVERDAATLWHLASAAEQAASRVDLSTVDDPSCRQVLDRFAAAGLLVGIWELTSDVGLPVFLCHLTTRAPDPARPLPAGAGQGCHTRREIALLRALTEAAQSRLTVIAGTRDDLFVDDYASLTESTALAAHRAFLAQQPAERPFTAAPTYDFPTFTADLQFVCDRLQAAGIREIIRVDLTQPEIGVPVVRVIVPGLEWEDEPPGSIQLGERARARRGEQ